MIRQTYTLEFLMPCFCAGADQSVAEIRPPSIRGQLRWWFRALGGCADDERAVFGGVAEEANKVNASSFTIRIDQKQPGPKWHPPAQLDLASNAYVYYFASVSGTAGRGAKGPRWTENGAVAPGTTVRLTILQRRMLTPELQSRFDGALRCFLQLGAIGLRVTRGLGSFVCREVPFTTDILDEIRQRGFRAELRELALTSEDQIAREIGSLLKGTRKATGYRHDIASPFGSSNPRQTSAIYFRPVRSQEQPRHCRLVVFEAPHQRVLDPKAQKPAVVGQTPSKLVKADSTGSQRGSRYSRR